MAKTKVDEKLEEKPERISFSIEKDAGETNPDGTPVIRNQDMAMEAANAYALEQGYNATSLQIENETTWDFIGYNNA